MVLHWLLIVTPLVSTFPFTSLPPTLHEVANDGGVVVFSFTQCADTSDLLGLGPIYKHEL